MKEILDYEIRKDTEDDGTPAWDVYAQYSGDSEFLATFHKEEEAKEYIKRSKKMSKKKFRKGERLYWHDPEEGRCSDWVTVVAHEPDREYVDCTTAAGSEVQAYPGELSTPEEEMLDDIKALVTAFDMTLDNFSDTCSYWDHEAENLLADIRNKYKGYKGRKNASKEN